MTGPDSSSYKCLVPPGGRLNERRDTGSVQRRKLVSFPLVLLPQLTNVTSSAYAPGFDLLGADPPFLPVSNRPGAWPIEREERKKIRAGREGGKEGRKGRKEGQERKAGRAGGKEGKKKGKEVLRLELKLPPKSSSTGIHRGGQ